MKAKSIKTVEVKEIGTINLNKIEAVSGQFEVFIPILHVNQEMDDLMEKLYKDFRSKHPEVDEKDICKWRLGQKYVVITDNFGTKYTAWANEQFTDFNDMIDTKSDYELSY